MEIKTQSKPRGRVANEQDLKPSDQLCKLDSKSTWSIFRLCVYRIYERILKAPTAENALILTAMDTGNKNTQEQDQVRVWAAPTAGPETNTILEDILGRQGGLWLPARESMLIAETREKYFLFLYYDLFYKCFWIFSLISLPPLPHFSSSVVVGVSFISSISLFKL